MAKTAPKTSAPAAALTAEQKANAAAVLAFAKQLGIVATIEGAAATEVAEQVAEPEAPAAEVAEAAPVAEATATPPATGSAATIIAALNAALAPLTARLDSMEGQVQAFTKAVPSTPRPRPAK